MFVINSKSKNFILNNSILVNNKNFYGHTNDKQIKKSFGCLNSLFNQNFIIFNSSTFFYFQRPNSLQN